MSPGRSEGLEAARVMLGLSNTTLWLAYISVGGSLALRPMQRFLAGRSDISDHEYDCLAQSLNDHFAEQGHDHPVPYADEL